MCLPRGLARDDAARTEKPHRRIGAARRLVGEPHQHEIGDGRGGDEPGLGETVADALDELVDAARVLGHDHTREGPHAARDRDVSLHRRAVGREGYPLGCHARSCLDWM